MGPDFLQITATYIALILSNAAKRWRLACHPISSNATAAVPFNFPAHPTSQMLVAASPLLRASFAGRQEEPRHLWLGA